MIWYKRLATFYISSLLQISLVQSQWNGGFSGYDSNYVPYTQGGTSFATSGSIQYVPLQGPPLGSSTYPIQNTNQPFDQYPSNVPIYSNTPTVSYQGLDEANALRSAYPNQPIIIINNGGNGDTGGNSNNGNNNGRKGEGFNFGDLAAILFATRHRGHGIGAAEGGPGLEQGLETAPRVTAPPLIAAPREVNSASGRGDNNKCSTVTHITIILPSSDSTISVEQKKKKGDDKDEEKKNKVKENKESKKTEVDDNDEIVEIKDDGDE